VIDKAPALLLKNPMPAPREALWFPQEIEDLKSEAEGRGMVSMAIAIQLLYETALSPADVRSLSLNMIAEDARGAYVSRKRTKTSKTAAMPLSGDLWRFIREYIERLPYELADDAPILRRHNTHKPWQDAPDFAKDFRRIREARFPDDKRQARDVRRTVSFEADLGGADASERGELLANAMGNNPTLEETYTPSNVIRARKTLEKRQAGQNIMRQIGTKRAPKV
jgi:integrase